MSRFHASASYAFCSCFVTPLPSCWSVSPSAPSQLPLRFCSQAFLYASRHESPYARKAFHFRCHLLSELDVTPSVSAMFPSFVKPSYVPPWWCHRHLWTSLGFHFLVSSLSNESHVEIINFKHERVSQRSTAPSLIHSYLNTFVEKLLDIRNFAG